MQEQPDVDPRLQADHPERARGVAGASDLRAARLSRRESDGGVAGLCRGTEGVLRKAPAEMGRQINFTVMSGLVPALSRRSTFYASKKDVDARHKAARDDDEAERSLFPLQLPPIC